MTLTAVVAAGFFASSPAKAATLSGNVSGSLDWSNGPYQVTGNITVPLGQTLTLSSGTILKFNSGLSLTVNGTLIADGTPAAPVTLTSIADDSVGGDTGGDGPTTGAAGQWGAVTFNGTGSSGSRLSNTLISFGQQVALASSSPQFNGVSIATMSVIAIAMDLASFPTGSGNAAYGSPVNGANLPSGTVSGTGTWGLVGIPYVIRSGLVQVGTGSGATTLTIAPGVTVKEWGRSGNVRLYVNDTLLAVGTPTQPITFTSWRDDTVGGDTNLTEGAVSPARGDVQEVAFNGANSSASRLENVTMRYAGSGTGSAVYLGSSSPALKNCDISQSSNFGVELDGTSAPTIDGCSIHDNSGRGVGYGSTSGAVTLTNNTFARNSVWGADLFSAAAVSSNTFDGNANGLYIERPGAATVAFTSNTFLNNTSAMVQIGANVYLSGGGNVAGTGNGNAGIDLAGGVTWTNSGTWQDTGLPYLLRNGLVQVGTGSGATTLTIAPGVTVKEWGRSGNVRLYVNDTLLAVGTPTQPITFTSWRDDTIGGNSNLGEGNTSPARGDVQEVAFNGANSSASRLENVVMRYAGSGTGSAVYLGNSSATIKNCDISLSSNFGVELDGNAAPTIDGCFIHDNSGRGVGYGSTSGAVALTNNTFARNSVWGADLYSAAAVSSNTFDGNGNGLYIERPGAVTVAFTSNTFSNNTSAMVQLGANVYLSGGGNVAGTGNGNAGIDLAGGVTWTNSGTWRDVGLPYLLRNGLVQVGTGSGATTLAIAPGVTIKEWGRSGNVRLYVNDTLLAVGTPSQPITFTSWRDDTVGGDTNLTEGAVSPARGDVQEIAFNGANSSASHLENVVMRYAGSGTGSAVYLGNSSATIKNCDISQSSNFGVELDGTSAPAIDGCFIHDNSGRGVGYGSTSGTVTLTNSTFARNSVWGADLYSAAAVSSNTFDGNANGLYIERPGAATVTLNSNTFLNNTSVMAQIGANVYLSGGGNVAGSGNGNAGIDLAGGVTWTNSGTWQDVGLPYLLRNGLVQVGTGSGATTLTIAPGVTVKEWGRSGNVRLYVNDTLLAVGTPSQPITFTSWRDDTIGGNSNLGEGNTSPARGDVQEIAFNGANSSASRLEHVVMRYAGSGTGSAVYLGGSSPTLKNCDISQSSNFGVELDGTSAPTIDGCFIHDNSGRGVGYGSTSGAATLTNNTFSRNSVWGADLYSAAAVSSNTFDGNANGLYIERPGAATVAFSSNTFLGNSSIMAQIGVNVYLSGAGNTAGAGNGNAGIDFVGGTWTNSGTWPDTGLPYLLRNGQVQIGTGSGAVTLTIAPGVVVKQWGRTNGSFRLLVDDKLLAVGTSSRPITFTSWRDDSIGGDTNLADGAAVARGDTNEIYLNGANTSGSRLENVVIEYAGAGTGSGLYIDSSSATIKNCQVKLSNAYGISVHGVNGKPPILATLLTQNPTGLLTDTKAIPEVHGCNIQGNTNVGLQNNDTTVVVNAQNNYWGDATGPKDLSNNPSDPTHLVNSGGLGDKVSDFVDYSNFLSTPASFIQPQVTSVQLLSPAPARPGATVSLKVFFNEDMDTSAAPILTYGQASPFDAYSISGGTWTTTTTFSSTLVLPALADGAYTLAVSVARDIIGNVVTPAQKAFYTVDGTPPGVPTLSNATPRSGGFVALGWLAPGGEVPAIYAVYRATADFTTAAEAAAVTTVTATSYTDLPPLDGSYVYAISARDAAGNESALSNRLTAVSLRAAPAAPTGLAGTFDPVLKQIALTWTAPSTGTAVSYNVYRSSALLANTPSTSYVDHPAADALELYEVAALDALGNLSARSTGTLVAYDVHAPTITVSRVTDGQYTNGNLTPSIAITDFSPFTSTSTLNGQPFISTVAIYQSLNQTVSEGGTASLSCSTGTIQSYTSVWATSCNNPHNCGSCPIDGTSCSVVYDNAHCGDVAPGCSKDGRLAINCGVPGVTLTQPGTYFLAISAQDIYANASSTTLRFTIDKASPTIVLLSPANGLVTNQNVIVAFQASDDLTSADQLVVKDELGNVVVSTYAITAEGTRSLTLTARDLAGNAASAGAVFILDKTPPAAVTDLRFVSQDKALGQATLAWSAPHDALSGTAGYLIKTATFPITSANFASATTIDYSSAPLTDGSTEQFVVAVTTSRTAYFALKSSDAAGNFSPISNSPFWDFDGPLLAGLNPAPGAVVSRPGTVTIQASDLSGVAQVAFSVDGVVLSTVTTPPYSFLWNTLAYADGSHQVAFNALDVQGNPSSLSASYTLVYQPPPSPTIAFPPNNYTTRNATLTVTGVAPIGTTVQILVDGFVLGSAPVSSTGSFSGSVFLPVQGTPLLTATASDSKGSSSQSSPVAVNYNLDPPGSPVNFMAASAPGGHVVLSWSAPSGKAASFYNVYRSTYAEALSSGAVPIPAYLSRASVTAAGFTDLPAQDGVYYYGATSLDSSGDESGLSAPGTATSDRVIPSAALVFVGTPPPLGLGAWPLQLTLSKPLASAPLLLFTPSGQSPLNVSLSASSPTVWTGTLTVTAAMNSGTGTFNFQGTDFVGNVGTSLTTGSAAAIDLTAPVGSIMLTPPSPEKAGTVALSLNLTKPVPASPALSYVTAAGSTVPVTLSGSGTTWTGTLTIASGSDGPATFAFRAIDGLGNEGTALSAGGSFAILTTPPGTPLFMRAIPQPAGGVHLTWSAPVSGTPASYDAYRNGVRISSGIAPLSDGSGAFNDAPTDGSYSYSASAVDAAGNESPQTTPIAALSKSTLPSAPVNSTATLTAFGHVEVGWQSGSTDSVSYKVYRTTAAIANLNIPITNSLSSTSAFSSLASTPPYVDTPPQNALYYYYLTAFDVAGNQSLPSAPATILWDRSPPTIVIAGVQEGGVYNHNVAPVFTATGSASAITASAILNSAAFVSGSTVSAEGDYTLTVNAVNQSNGSSTSTVHFTLDKTSPTVAITGIPAGTSHSSVLPQVTVNDLHLAAVNLTLDGGAYTQGTPITTNGDHVFAVNALDAAGNVTISSVPFSLNIPPTTPGNFTMAAVDGVGATFSWQAPASGLAGYRFYRDGVLLSQGLLTGLQFQDASFTLGTAHLYEVSAVDSSGQEGGRTQLTVPAATFQLASYGANVNGIAALTRGFFDTVNLQLVNSGSQSLLIGPATVELISSTSTIFTGQVPSASVSAGASAVVPAVVATPSSIADAPSLRVTLQLPSGIGTHATIAKTFTLAARTPLGTAVELYAGPMIFDANASVQVKFNNKGSAPLEIRTAINSDVGVSLATPQGTVLSNASLNQTADGAQTGSGVYFVSIGPGASFLFDAVPVFVPSALGSSAVLAVHIGQAYNGLAGSQPLKGAQSFDASQTVSGVIAPAYTATISPDKAVYDQGSTVILSGEARDSANALVPGATVQAGVSVQSFVRSLSTMTDASGRYSLTFNPAPTEAGLYTLWATNPSVVSRIPQSSFTIVGFAYQYSSFNTAVVQNSTQTFSVGLTNTGQAALTGLAAQLSVSSVAGVSLALDPASVPASLGGGQTANLSFAASAALGASLGSVPFSVQVRESHGFVRNLPVTVAVSAAAPGPSANPQVFTLGMNAGQTQIQTVVLRNLGTQSWTGVSISAPALSWVAVQGNITPGAPFTLGDIPPGGYLQFNLVVSPPAGLPSQAYALNPLVQVNSTNAQSLPVNALITITAGTTGGVVYNVINADKPRDQFGSGVPVAGAQAQLLSLDIAGLSFNAVVDANSVARFGDVPAGRYNLTIKAAGFSDFLGTETIQPGVTNTREILMLTQVISYVWSVTPTTIVDQYNLKLSLTFKTDVPAPIVVVSPAAVNLEMSSGDTYDGQMTVTNMGIISAFSVSLAPKIPNPAIRIDFPYSTIPELKAGQTVVIPYHLTLIHASCEREDLVSVSSSTCAAGSTVIRTQDATTFTAGHCNLPPTTIYPVNPQLPTVALQPPGTAAAPTLTAAAAGVVAPAAPPASGCTCSMSVKGPAALLPTDGTTTYTATVTPNNCGCTLSCDLGWLSSDEANLHVVSQSACTAQVKAVGLKGGTLTVKRNGTPTCSGQKVVTGCQPQITATPSPAITQVAIGSPITLTATTPPGCPAQTISWSPASSPQGTLTLTSGATTTFTPGSTPGSLTITAQDTTPGSTLSVSTVVFVTTVPFIGASGHNTAGGDAFDRINIEQGVNLGQTVNDTASVIPPDPATTVQLTDTFGSFINVTPFTPQSLPGTPTSVSIQGVVGGGSTIIQPVIPHVPPIVVGKLPIEVFGPLHQSIAIHILNDNSGIPAHDATRTLSVAGVNTIMNTVNSIWAQANVIFDVAVIDTITVDATFGDAFVYVNTGSDNYLAALDAADTPNALNVYYVFNLSSTTVVPNPPAAVGLTGAGDHHVFVSVNTEAATTAHEIGHAFDIDNAPLAGGADYTDPARTYELMSAEEGSGTTVTPRQGRVLNPSIAGP